jgi:Mlc titration factor MtfA (ptsG expression regulator)
MLAALLIAVGIVAATVLAFVLFFKTNRQARPQADMPENYRQILQDHVLFYQRLDDDGKKQFEQRVQHFLSGIRITGVRTTVEDIDRVFVGASAIIPIFAFPDWEYIHLNEVLLYPETFNHEFELEGEHRSIAGMVGSGAMQNVMVISQPALREGFSNKTDKHNTAIHEFVHLIDKTDGYVDGVPELLMEHRYVLPWMNMVRENINAIMKNKSNIDPYAATSAAEFFAVVAEHFFERPDTLKSKHPDLYNMLDTVFRK